MAISQKSHTELNSVQISLLRLFNRPMSESEAITLKKLMVDYYSGLLEDEVTKIVAEKKYSQKDFDNMLNSED